VTAAAASSLTRSRRDLVAAAGFLLVALAVGVLAGASPMLAIAVGGALVFTLIVISDLMLGVCLFLLVTFLDVVSTNQNISVTKGAGALLAGAWLATIATRPGSRRSLTSSEPWLVATMLAFLAWSAMSAVWAENSSAVAQSTFRFALDAMLMPIVFSAVRERKHVVWILAVFVVGALLSVAWGATHAAAAGSSSARQAGRLSGATVEANVLATLLIVCMVFAVALAMVLRRSPVARALSVFAALAAAAAFFGTFSRGGIVALGVVILAGCVYAAKWRRAFVALAIGVALVGAVFVQDTTSGAVQRLTSTDTSGRADIWKVGLRMVRAHPVVGVGSGNYTTAEPHYLLTSAGAIKNVNLILISPHVAHNIYLHVLAEMGVIGLALFLSIIGLSIRCAVKAVALFRARGERSLEILGRALVIAITGILAADFFVSEQYSKQLWLLLAIGPALLAIARGSPVARRTPARPLMPPRRDL
jgi:O-antigen ligase